MSDTSTHLGLPYLLAAQAQKHVTHNEALRLLDGLVQLAALDRDLTAPPGSPADGDRYIVGSGATGDWAGWDRNVALRTDGAWLRLPPRTGWLAWIADEGQYAMWDGSAWVTSIGNVTAADLATGALARIGVNSAADATNRLAVKSDGIQFSHDDVTPGTGNLRVSLNKSAAAKDAAFVFQGGGTTRALFGLLGDDDWRVKVSPDGVAFFDGIVIDRNSGAVSHPVSARFSAYLNFGQTYAAGAWRDLLFNSTRHNDQGAFQSLANVGTFTAPVGGKYLFGLGVTYESTGGADPTQMRIGFSVNGLAPTADMIAAMRIARVQRVAITGERNGGMVVGNTLAYGNGDSSANGTVMAHAGKVTALSMSRLAGSAGAYTLDLHKNGAATGASLALNFPTNGRAYAVLGTPVSFVAGDQLNLTIVAAPVNDGDLGGTFFADLEDPVASGEIALATTALLTLAAGDMVRGAVFFSGSDGRIGADENHYWGVRIA